jgi:hypothetical protein
LIDKLLRGQSGYFAREWENQDLLDRFLAHQLRPALGCGQQARRAIGANHAGRMRVKRENRWLPAVFLG